MKEFNPEEITFETVTAIGAVRQAQTLSRYPAYIGLDVHKDTIAVAVAREGREEPEFRGEIANKPKTVAKLVERLSQEFNGEVLLFCYEGSLWLCVVSTDKGIGSYLSGSSTFADPQKAGGTNQDRSV